MTDQAEHTLPLAQLTLDGAVDRLIGVRTAIVAGNRVTGPSLYRELIEYNGPTHASDGGGSHARSTPAALVEVVDLKEKIETEVAAWCGVGCDVEEALADLAAAHWRPQDVAVMNDYSAAVHQWCHEIESLLDPPKRITLAADCPACGARTVHRPDNGGDWVRQPALQIGDRGCECQRCHARWGPESYLFLARVLGYELPSGVLE